MKNDFIIIPTYNERTNITQLIESVFLTVPDIHVLVVDDNSPDGTADVVRASMLKFPKLELLSRAGKEGLGKAYVHAFREVLAKGDVQTIIMMDADFSHSPTYLPELLKGRKTADIVVGSRYAQGGQTVGWELWRRVLSYGGNLYCRLITGIPVQDCTGGFNAVNASVLRTVDLDSMDMSGYAFIMELKYLLYAAGASFKEIPIIFKNRTGGESKISGHIISEGLLAPWKMKFKKTSRA